MVKLHCSPQGQKANEQEETRILLPSQQRETPGPKLSLKYVIPLSRATLWLKPLAGGPLGTFLHPDYRKLLVVRNAMCAAMMLE